MRNLYFRISTFYSLISTKHTAINKILTPHGLSVIGGNKRQKVKILKFRMWFKYPLPLLYPSASDFQFRYAPVTVGSGRVGLTCET